MGAVRFTIDVDGEPRSLFRVVERRDEVTLGLKSPVFNARQAAAKSALDVPEHGAPSKVIEQRYQIHPSRESATGISAINQTMILANGKRIRYRHYTKVIKSRENFAFIYCRRCGRLERPELIPRGKFENISLGTFEPQNFTLIYAVLIGARDKEFIAQHRQTRIGIIQHPFNNLRIIVLWTFLNTRSHPIWMTAHLETIPPEILAPTDRDLADGLNPYECVRMFAEKARELTEDLFQSLDPLTKKDDMAEARRTAAFFEVGSRQTKEYEIHRFIKAAEKRPYSVIYRIKKSNG